MKLSVNWLKQFVTDFDNDETETVVKKLKSSLAEVEENYEIASALENIIAGEIVEIVDHPTLNKLKIAMVKINESTTLEILCGAPNIKVGSIVPVCLPGGTVYNPKPKEEGETVKITEKEMGGKKSQGMLCSEKELGIGDDHSGIYLLPDSTPLGFNVSEVLKDTVIDVENKGITNRPDCFSHVGIAREIAVQNKLKFVPSPEVQKPIKTADKPLKVKVEDTESTKRYTAVVISDVKIKESPLWLKARISACGVRPVNNIVDITNYLMLELGQPSHAFDYDKIAKHTLILRKAAKGEQITTLDGKKRTLEEGMLINTDAEKPLGIAGVMGGMSSEITAKTKNIVLQVENFEMYNIRGTTRKLGLRTEASTRFEKGLDPNLVEECVYRAVEMIVDIAGGEVSSEVIDVYPQKEEQIKIRLYLPNVKRILGIDIEKNEVMQILEALGLEIKELKKENILELSIPSFRRDLRIEEDVIEDIARIYGYDKFGFDLPARTLFPVKRNLRFEVEKQIIKELVSTGSTQVFSYSFIGDDLYEKAMLDIKECLKIANPLSPELGYLRNTIIPSILEKIALNQIKYPEQDVFEISKTVLKQIDQQTGMHLQPKYLSGAMLSTDKNLYNQAKGKLEYLIDRLGVTDLKFENLNGGKPFMKSNIFHPQKSALIYSGETQIGIIGYVNPKVLDNFEITEQCVAYELNFDLLVPLTRERTQYRKIYNFPIVKRVISFWVDEKVEARQIFEAISAVNDPNLVETEITDIYRDKLKEKGKKSISLEFSFQSPVKTLTDEEIGGIIEQLNKELKSKLRADIRDNAK